MRQPNGAPVAITGLWDLEFGDGTPNSGKTNQLFFDAGPNAPGVSGYGLFGVIRAAGDQSGNAHSDTAAAPSQPVQQALSRATSSLATSTKSSTKSSTKGKGGGSTGG